MLRIILKRINNKMIIPVFRHSQEKLLPKKFLLMKPPMMKRRNRIIKKKNPTIKKNSLPFFLSSKVRFSMEEKKIIIPQGIYNNMLKHGRSSLPFEACGLLSGNNHKINSIWQLENRLRSDRRFFVEKRTIEKTIQEIKKLSEQVLAVYHSHPTTAPVPSVYDITNHPDNKVKMVIISFKTNPPFTKCYQIEKNSYEECLFCINPSL
ncbi:M67 family peptidase [Oceanobacillus profundus]|uniref:M67 family peptidase n=2 Tax=Bacillaceae TaxID=186817 RepID=A0A417YAB7_9BACI|nr:hypothetical protein CHI07_21710 [Paenibacillus sp. 7884-2]RHW29648.1 M67 family peptidase [Oceanobacillus profundus]